MSNTIDIITESGDTTPVNILTLKSFAIVRGLNQSDLARVAGVTRQTVSHWFSQKEGTVNLYARHLGNLARVLGTSVEQLSQPLPILGDSNEREKWESEFLWDSLYPDLETFIAGLIRGQRPALARLVQVVGLYEGEKIAGKQVWRKFFAYKSLIHPTYRKQAEIIWKTAQDLSQH